MPTSRPPAELQSRATEVLGWVADGTLSVRIGRGVPARRGRRGASRARGSPHDRKGAAPSLDAAHHSSARPPARRAHLGRQLHRHQAGVLRDPAARLHGGAVHVRRRCSCGSSSPAARDGGCRPRSTWLPLIALGIVGNTIYQLCFMTGLSRTTATNSSLILASMPTVVTVAAGVLGLRGGDGAAEVGAGDRHAGRACSSWRRAASPSRAAISRGDMLMLAAVVCWADLHPRPAHPHREGEHARPHHLDPDHRHAGPAHRRRAGGVAAALAHGDGDGAGAASPTRRCCRWWWRTCCGTAACGRSGPVARHSSPRSRPWSRRSRRSWCWASAPDCCTWPAAR